MEREILDGLHMRDEDKELAYGLACEALLENDQYNAVTGDLRAQLVQATFTTSPADKEKRERYYCMVLALDTVTAVLHSAANRANSIIHDRNHTETEE